MMFEVVAWWVIEWNISLGLGGLFEWLKSCEFLRGSISQELRRLVQDPKFDVFEELSHAPIPLKSLDDLEVSMPGNL